MSARNSAVRCPASELKQGEIIRFREPIHGETLVGLVVKTDRDEGMVHINTGTGASYNSITHLPFGYLEGKGEMIRIPPVELVRWLNQVLEKTKNEPPV